MKSTTEILARNVRRLMRQRGLSQTDLGHLAGISQRTVSNVVRGAHQPRMDVVDALAKALDVTTSELCRADAHKVA